MDWFCDKESVRQRTLTEEFVRDRFEKLLFSLCGFCKLTRCYLSNITVVSYDFRSEDSPTIKATRCCSQSRKCFFFKSRFLPPPRLIWARGEKSVGIVSGGPARPQSGVARKGNLQ
nr:hypothetical protein PHYPA_021364 [Physcomitrium patens]